MLSAVCRQPGRIELKTMPIPVVDENKILVKVIACGICGSDISVWQGYDKRYPYSPGHEFCGTVERTGSKVQSVSPGQRIVANPNLGCGHCPYCLKNLPNLCDFLKTRPIKSNGGFSEYVALDYRMAYPVPSSIDEKLATFIEPLSCALHLVELAEMEGDKSAAIFGGGTLGILTALVIRSKGGRCLFIEPLPHRRRQPPGRRQHPGPANWQKI